MRYRAKVDNIQREITEKLRKLGYSVLCLHMVGKGCPDLLIGKDGRNWLVELKSSEKAKLTPDEVRFLEKWQGRALVACSVDQIMEKIK